MWYNDRRSEPANRGAKVKIYDEQAQAERDELELGDSDWAYEQYVEAGWED